MLAAVTREVSGGAAGPGVSSEWGGSGGPLGTVRVTGARIASERALEGNGGAHMGMSYSVLKKKSNRSGG